MPPGDGAATILLYARYFTRSSESVIADLESYALLLAKWQRVQNLVSRETLEAVWTRHFADSLQVLAHLGKKDLHLLDLGSGGGFPALPLAVALKGEGRKFTLVEPNGRKASFLRTVIRELSLDGTVIGGRGEDLDSRETGAANVVTARAVAPLARLCSLAAPLLRADGRAIFHKGREHGEELAQAGALWHYDVIITPSDTDPGGVLVELSHLRARTTP